LGETIELQTVPASGGWLALIDRSQLENALLNLVINARDAMVDGGKLIIETKDLVLDEIDAFNNPDMHSGEYVMLAVHDNGVGIDPELLGRVFDPFFTTKDVGKGSGLGLSMVHGFVRQSGGFIEITSEFGQGTSVMLYLPRSRERALPDKGPERFDIRCGGETILVVEDETEVRTMIASMLQRFGYRVLVAADGEEALAQLKANDSIDLLLTDVILPGGMTGPDIAKAVGQTQAGIKVLFMSGYTNDAIARHGSFDEGTPLIKKPFSSTELTTRVCGLLASA